MARRRRITPEPAPLPALPEWVWVEVVVNHGHQRRGNRYQTEVTPRVQALLNSGYLQLVGPVVPAVESPWPANTPPGAATVVVVFEPLKSRPTREATADGRVQVQA
jgi:hypothetical protein